MAPVLARVVEVETIRLIRHQEGVHRVRPVAVAGVGVEAPPAEVEEARTIAKRSARDAMTTEKRTAGLCTAGRARAGFCLGYISPAKPLRVLSTRRVFPVAIAHNGHICSVQDLVFKVR